MKRMNKENQFEMVNKGMQEILSGDGFHGGEQQETLPGGGFHGGEQQETLPGGGFHGGEQQEILPDGCIDTWTSRAIVHQYAFGVET